MNDTGALSSAEDIRTMFTVLDVAQMKRVGIDLSCRPRARVKSAGRRSCASASRNGRARVARHE